MSKMIPEEKWMMFYNYLRVGFYNIARNSNKKISFYSNISGNYQVYVYDLEGRKTIQITNEPAGQYTSLLSDNGEELAFLRSSGGSQQGHYVIKNIYDKEFEEIVAPEIPPISSYLEQCYITNDASGVYFLGAGEGKYTIYKYLRKEKKTEILIHQTAFLFLRHLSYDEKYALINTGENCAPNLIDSFVYDLHQKKIIAKFHYSKDSMDRGHLFNRDGQTIAVETNHGTFNRHERSGVWNFKTNEKKIIKYDEPGDMYSCGWVSPNKLLVKLSNFESDQLLLWDYKNDTLEKLDNKKGDYPRIFVDNDGIAFGTYTSAEVTSTPFRYDLKENKFELLDVFGVKESCNLPTVGKTESVIVKSGDGTNVQSWVTYPGNSRPPSGFPTMMMIHGGPGGCDTNTYDGEVSAFASLGFFVIRPNYRGSSGFGDEFYRKIFTRMGQYEVMDIKAVAQHFIKQGLIDPDQLFITGGSYGGYLTLMSMVKEPDLFKAGCCLAGIADWPLIHEDARADIRNFYVGAMGGTPQEVPERYVEASPMTYVKDIKNPILIIQGKNDTTCPIRQMDVFVEKLKALNVDHDYHVFDAGHGSLDTNTNIGFTKMWLKFLEDRGFGST